MGYNFVVMDRLLTHLDATACYRALRTRDARFDGRFFTAVLSTGIYCRPVCPAPTPKPDNVRFYAHAAAAEAAGFRPCLRCRPETVPGSAPWRGTSTTVTRALRLIADGVLDRQDVDALASRVGVGARHLRRLFLRHLGTTPIAVAQTRRLAFAKKLIDETCLPMETVALAAGFTSVRRFNSVVRAAYRRSPRQLRRRCSMAPPALHERNGPMPRAREGRSDLVRRDAASDVTLRLAYRPPYDWEALRRFFAVRAVPGLESVRADCYRRCLRLEGGTVLVEIRHARDDHHMLARIRFADAAFLMNIVGRLRHLLDLDADPEAIARHLQRDARLAPLVRRHPGLRLPGTGDAFEAAVRAILGQQVSVRAATQLLARVVAAHGDEVDGGAAGMPELQRAFPGPEILARTDLSRLGVPVARAETLRGLARAVADGRVNFRSASLQEFVDSLCALPGIGPWTAHTIALRGLGEPDAFPAGDLGLCRALGRGGRRLTPRQVEAAAEAWRPWRAYAAVTLWNGGRPHADAHG